MYKVVISINYLSFFIFMLTELWKLIVLMAHLVLFIFYGINVLWFMLRIVLFSTIAKIKYFYTCYVLKLIYEYHTLQQWYLW